MIRERFRVEEVTRTVTHPPRCIMFERSNRSDSEPPLQQWGQIVHMYDENNTRPSIFSPELGGCLSQRLQEMGYNPDTDYIACNGINFVIAMLCSIVAADYGTFKALAWDARHSNYREVTMG